MWLHHHQAVEVVNTYADALSKGKGKRKQSGTETPPRPEGTRSPKRGGMLSAAEFLAGGK